MRDAYHIVSVRCRLTFRSASSLYITLLGCVMVMGMLSVCRLLNVWLGVMVAGEPRVLWMWCPATELSEPVM